MVRDEEQKKVTRKSLDHISWTVVSVECSEEGMEEGIVALFVF